MTVSNPELNPISCNEIQQPPSEGAFVVISRVVLLADADVSRNSLVVHGEELDFSLPSKTFKINY